MPRGRPKGSASKATRMREKVYEAQGTTPLAFMLETLRNEENDFPTRMDAAKAAAPYVHPRLSSVDASVHAKVDIYSWMLDNAEDKPE